MEWNGKSVVWLSSLERGFRDDRFRFSHPPGNMSPYCQGGVLMRPGSHGHVLSSHHKRTIISHLFGPRNGFPFTKV